jgi:hypothetical protein
MPWPVVSTRCVLGRLTPQEVGEYIESRLRMAGGDRSMFDRDAIQHVAEISRGALGVVNVVCEHALLAGSRKRARLIGRDLIDDCLAERGLSHTDGPGEASDSPRGDRAAVGRGEPGARKGDESERLIRRTRARWVAALGGAGLLVALAVAGGYALRATRTGRMSPQAAPAPARDLTSAPQINPPAAAVEGPTAPIEAPSPVAPPAITSEPTAPAGEGRREVRRPAAGIPRPPRVEDTRPPNPPARRDQPGSRAAEGRSESPDPGAVIDWLLERSSKP